LNTISV